MLIGIDANEANLTHTRVGINQYAFDLLHALYAQDTLHDFVIYLKTPPLADLPKARSNWSYRVIPFPKLWTQTRLPWDLYTHRPRPAVFFSLTHYAPRFSPVPTVVAIMDLGFLKFPDQFTPKDYNQLKSWTAYSVRQASKLITISQHTKLDIQSVYHVPADKIVVTYPGIDTTVFKPTKNLHVLAKYKIHLPYFLFLGSLRPSKNIENLIRAFAAGRFTHQLVIAGKKGWLYDQIFKLVSDLHLESRVLFTGYLDESEVPAFMSLATAFVQPSFYEGFGIPVLEAMACGTPVVISSVASLPEVAGDAGIYVDPNSTPSITQGLEVALGSKRDHFIRLGLQQAQHFSWSDTAQLTLHTLESVVR